MPKNKVREARIAAGLSQVELARKACLADSNLNAIENGRVLPWPKAKQMLAEALGKKIEELFPEDCVLSGK